MFKAEYAHQAAKLPISHWAVVDQKLFNLPMLEEIPRFNVVGH